MSKIHAPLVSLSASGSIGKSVTHQTWKGLHLARSTPFPTDARSPAQLSQRSVIKTWSTAWKNTPFTEIDRLAFRKTFSYLAWKTSPFFGFTRLIYWLGIAGLNPWPIWDFTYWITPPNLWLSFRNSYPPGHYVYYQFSYDRPGSWQTWLPFNVNSDPFVTSVPYSIYSRPIIYSFLTVSGGGDGWITGIYKIDLTGYI